eukprot:PLAT13234.1.p1 GENE.PLAT13234.1~~PLAT13234.1.p1  ORF type:complete len:382 (-),score=112.04 PLAT13234.1:94-1170(-)
MGHEVDPLGLTLAGAYAICFLLVIAQAVRMVREKHRLASFQSAFLAICALWMPMRVIMFLKTVFTSVWSTQALLVLYWVPTSVQFATFSLLVLFYGHVVHRKAWRRVSRYAYTIYGLVNAVLVLTTVALIWLASTATDCPGCSNVGGHVAVYYNIFNGLAYVLLAVLLVTYGFKFAKLASQDFARVLLPMRPRSFMLLNVVMTLSFSFRAVYNLAHAAGLWTLPAIGVNGSHHAPLQASIFASMIVWEVLPSFLFLAVIARSPSTSRRARKSVPKDVMQRFLDSPREKHLSVSTASPPPPISIVASTSATAGKLSVFDDPHRYDSPAIGYGPLTHAGHASSASASSFAYPPPSSLPTR